LRLSADLSRPEFVEKHCNQARIRATFFIESGQQRRRRNGAACLRQARVHLRIDKGVVAFQRADCRDGMQRPARYSEHAARRHDPPRN
jgi:hypothetical protein